MTTRNPLQLVATGILRTRICLLKKAFDEYRRAAQETELTYNASGKVQKVYLCKFCGKFHVTNKR